MQITIDGQQHEVTHCYAVLDRFTMIDIQHPITGRSLYANETLEQVQVRYPGAEVMTLDAFMEKKAEAQNSPIVWEEITQEQYDEMLCCLPPAAMNGFGFLMGEPMDHCAATGKPRYSAFIVKQGKYYESNRPMTVKEFASI